MQVPQSLYNLTNAEDAFMRVQGKLETVPADQLRPYNVELVSSTSIVLGVSDRVLEFRDRAAALPEFDVSCFDNLVDYALATWFVHVTNLPEPEPVEADAWIVENQALRGKLLMWAEPLAGAGVFDQVAVDQIKQGQGHKDAASDVVALVGLYRSRWEQAQPICGVTEADLNRAADLGPKVFALVGHRENRLRTRSDTSLRVHRTWSLLDHAYSQCRRAVQFFRFDEGDADVIAPNLRKNTPKGTSASTQASSSPTASPAPAVGAPAAVAAAPALGGNDSPFTAGGG